MEIIRIVRESRGWSQGELADKCGLSRGALCTYETGKVEVSVTNLLKIAKALQIPMDLFLMTHEDYKSANPDANKVADLLRQIEKIKQEIKDTLWPEN